MRYINPLSLTAMALNMFLINNRYCYYFELINMNSVLNVS